MNILYLVGVLLMAVILGYAYIIFVKAKNEKGVTRVIGFVLSGLLTTLLVLLIILYATGVVRMPRFMPERPTMRMMQGMSAYTIGMMSDDPKTVDEFIAILKTKSELYNKFREKLE